MSVPEQRSSADDLEQVVDDLAHRFAGRHSRETVSATVHRIYDDLAHGARVTTYLPVLARHEAQNQLSAAS